MLWIFYSSLTFFCVCSLLRINLPLDLICASAAVDFTDVSACGWKSDAGSLPKMMHWVCEYSHPRLFDRRLLFCRKGDIQCRPLRLQKGVCAQWSDACFELKTSHREVVGLIFAIVLKSIFANWINYRVCFAMLSMTRMGSLCYCSPWCCAGTLTTMVATLTGLVRRHVKFSKVFWIQTYWLRYFSTCVRVEHHKSQWAYYSTGNGFCSLTLCSDSRNWSDHELSRDRKIFATASRAAHITRWGTFLPPSL